MNKVFSRPIIIIGAGPAGLSAAITLAEHGKRVIIFDKNLEGQINNQGETKLCGGGLIPISQKFLGNLESQIKENKNFITKTVHCSANVYLDYSSVTTINRDLLAKELADKTRKLGVKIYFKTPILDIDIKNKYIETKKNKVYFQVLIGADGAFSIVRKELIKKGILKKDNRFLQAIEYKIKSDKINQPLTVDFDYRLFSGGYAWIFPHKNYTYIGAGESNITRIKKSRFLVDDLLVWVKKNSFPIDKNSLRGWIIPYYYQGYKFKNNIYLIGDAAGFTGGFLGEGISFALLSGYDVARLIIDQNYYPKNIKRILKIKKRHEILLSISQKLPLLGAIIINTVVWLAKNKITLPICLWLYNLQKEK
jgi:flavin-dependent dehydrogenase